MYPWCNVFLLYRGFPKHFEIFQIILWIIVENKITKNLRVIYRMRLLATCDAKAGET